MPTKTIQFDAQQFQWDFFSSIARYPAMVAAWGTGKTTFALMKGIQLTQLYKDNLGVVVRKEYTALRDSTMKDYTAYTGKTIPQGTKESAWANGSKILFRHAKNLDNLNNVNIGWFYIEQAEEFASEKQFNLLRGRLRRVLTPTDEVQKQLMNVTSDITGMPALKEVVDNWRSLNKNAVNIKGENIVDPNSKKGKLYVERDIAEIALNKQLNTPLRQGIVIANANGHNWTWKKFVKSNFDEHSCVEACSWDNEQNLPRDTIADWVRMETEDPATYKQYVLNNHDEVDLEACYYIEIMNHLRSNGHICHLEHDPSARVHLSFDIGLDCTAIWFVQFIKGKRNVIDYYENTGKFAAHYAKVLDKRGYKYGKLVLPHDGKSRSKVSGESYAKAFRDLGYDVVVNKRVSSKDIAINITADHLPSLYFDEDKCKDGLEALDHYRREYDEELKIYREKPLHDWASHPCDSMAEMCSAIKSGKLRSQGSGQSVTDSQISKWQKKYSRTG